MTDGDLKYRSTVISDLIGHMVRRTWPRRSFQSCPWVGLTRGLGWVGSWVSNDRCAKKYMSCICNFVSSIDWQIRFVKTCSWCITASSVWNRPNMTVMLVILWVFALLRCALGWWWWHDVHKLIFLRQASCCSMYGGSVGYGLGRVVGP